MELYELTYDAVARGLRSGEFSARELVASSLDRIEAVEPVIAAFVSIRDRSELLAEAERADAARSRGDDGALLGVPVAIKDNISTRGIATTCGSRILEHYTPPFDATAVVRLRSAGAIIVGKTNLDEFGMGSSNEHSAFGATRNPWDTDRVPGGSSGGSAAAVAACEVPLALGTDTGGSVRQPASLCGVVGVKPTYGRVSRYGLVAFASSLDQIGTLSRDVEGAATLLAVIAGHDPRDATSADVEPPELASCPENLSGVTVGVPEECFGDGLDPEVARAVTAAIDLMKELGASISRSSLPHLKYGIPAYYLVADAEASSNLARFDGVRYGHRSAGAGSAALQLGATRSAGLGAEVKRRIMLGTYALSAGYYDQFYLKAQKVRTLVASDFTRAFERCDVLVSPTSPVTAFRAGERLGDPLAMYLSDIYTVPASLAGIAAMSVPCGLSSDGLPVGLQFMIDRFREPAMLAVAARLERALGHPPGPPLL
ncbi:MAG: Asp-tRNA(Asn)/Glu-tRNA(Gln) amidotransferase subunit GatA [Candidatus Eisenbacteria bacterium]|nr:Asp-tRNA(Asn)/Glu-tRNA(Gln) amidotransferase subunit GatA [Candidatus Eisenbacteria bacterium]